MHSSPKKHRNYVLYSVCVIAILFQCRCLLLVRSDGAFRRATSAAQTSQQRLPLSSRNVPIMATEPRPDFRICRVGKRQTKGYVCRGKAYDIFADELQGLLRRHEASLLKQKEPWWGKRNYPFPANTTTLVVGNSLTRQVMSMIPCQYGNVLQAWVDREANQTKGVRKATFYEGNFVNGARVFVVTNHAMFYSPHWPRFLMDLIGGPKVWDSLDLMIVGNINDFQQAYKTNFMDIMREQTKQWDGANFETVAPPQWSDFSRVFPPGRPMIGVSMMTDWTKDDADYRKMKKQLKKIVDEQLEYGQNPYSARPMAVVHGRKYVPELGECGSDTWTNVSECIENPTLHRCIGRKGGHPDLVAFDMVEAVHNVLSSKSHLNGQVLPRSH